jgi:hypothetical protein
MRRLLIAVVLLSMFTCSIAIAQGGFAHVSGTVSDPTGAVIPGVTVIATDVNTGVVSTQITEETGAYNFVSLLPGKYKISAALNGFQTQTITDLQFGSDQYRLNFTLKLGQSAGVSIDVVESGAAILAASSSSVGTVLSQSQVQALPLLGNNVLDLVGLLGGVGNTSQLGTTFGGELVTFAGVSAANIPTVRDGLMVQDVRYGTGISSNTNLNPDLVGEIRLILSPVDAEYGRGNGSVQITTRSGTNRYTGTAVVTAQNSAFNARTFEQRRATPPGIIPYSNNLEGSVSFGGPIVKNKTFFYALYDQTSVRSRSNVVATVLTPCARNGVFRYFDFWNNGNANAATVETGNTPTIQVVNLDGSPKTPDHNPGTAPGSGYTGQMRAISVFGPLLNASTLNADCSNAIVDSALPWDTFRTSPDPSGYVSRMMAYMPMPNQFTTGDGLNTASISWLRGNQGGDNLFGVGQDAGARKQINVKIDQNFNQNHKANVGVTYERDKSSDSQPSWPGSFAGPAYRRPYTITSSFTSTLSSSLVNEARFGLRRSGSNSTAPYDYPPNLDLLSQLLPAPVNGVRVLPRMGTGGVNFQSTQPLALNQGAQWSYTLRDESPNYTFSDNVSWTHGLHSFRFGGELRLIRSKGEQNGDGTNFTSLMAIGGNTAGAPVRNGTVDSIGATNPAMANIRSGDQQRARDLLTFLSGSLGSLNEWFFMMDPKKTDAYEDYRTFPFRVRETRSKEISAFVKDDWKIRKDLTLNLGVRYDYYGVPFIASGLTIAPVGGADALFGISGRDFSNWLTAPATGTGAAAYNPNLLTQVQFVGPNSQNPDLKAMTPHYKNFGPAIGFAWNPWFGEGKLSVRGGYQLTFSAPQTASAVEAAISNPPGSVVAQTYAPTAGDPDPYLDLTDLGNSALVPLVTAFKPVQTPPVENRGTGNSYTAYDARTKSPYVQNFTLTVSRNFGRKLSTEMRYVGTMSTHQLRTTNLNTSTFLRNPLFQELDSIRRGTDATPLLDQMFQGVNMCFTGAGCPTTYLDASGTPVTAVYGPIGSTPLQTVGYQMRLHPTFNTNIANGDYQTVMTGNAFSPTSLNNYNANLTGPTGSLGRVMRNSGLFPENFFVANPQFSAANYNSNYGHSNYHSLQAQATFNPIQGVSASATYTFSKGMTLANTLTDPLDRSEVTVTGNRPHEFRTNGVIELPIGPNKIIMGNSSGWLARVVERWQTSFAINMSSGSWSNIAAVNRMYGVGVPDVITPVDFNAKKDYSWGNEIQGTQKNGDYFGGDDFVTIPDPQCGVITTKQNLNIVLGATTQTPRCTLRALALIVPTGTPGGQPLTDFIPTDTTGRTVKIALQNPNPGMKGTLGPAVIKGFGIFSFDLAASKSFRISESKSVQIRIDGTNILNHPSPVAPTLDINGNNTFGNVTSKTGSRVMQGQLRFSF